MQSIKINNWEKFQHYKDRRPTWIKLLTEIIDEFDADGNPKKFYYLPDCAKKTFPYLICLRANYNEKIPYPSDKWLKKRLGLKSISLQPLIDAGFITIDTESVSKPYQGGTESAHQRESKRERESKSICTELFDKFWKAYPRKEAKGRARGWFTKNQPTDEDVRKMLYLIREQSFSGGRLHRRLKEHMKYIPLPTTWLNDGDWQDAPTEADTKKQTEQQADAEQKALEKERLRIRKEDGQQFRKLTTEKLQEMSKDKYYIPRHWLIREILQERENAI